jgi:hypothetical protein
MDASSERLSYCAAASWRGGVSNVDAENTEELRFAEKTSWFERFEPVAPARSAGADRVAGGNT